MIEMSIEDIIAVAKIGEQHGAEIIETYLLGDRSKGEHVNVWDRNCLRHVQCYEYPWTRENYQWDEFSIGEIK